MTPYELQRFLKTDEFKAIVRRTFNPAEGWKQHEPFTNPGDVNPLRIEADDFSLMKWAGQFITDTHGEPILSLNRRVYIPAISPNWCNENGEKFHGCRYCNGSGITFVISPQAWGFRVNEAAGILDVLPENRIFSGMICPHCEKGKKVTVEGDSGSPKMPRGKPLAEEFYNMRMVTLKDEAQQAAAELEVDESFDFENDELPF